MSREDWPENPTHSNLKAETEKRMDEWRAREKALDDEQAYDEGFALETEDACPFEPTLEECPYPDASRRTAWIKGYKDGCEAAMDEND